MKIEAKFHFERGDFVLDVAFQIPARGVTALFGPSGCGKTTLLRLIAGLEFDPCGRLSIDGEVWQDGAAFTPTHRRALGFVFQETSLFPHLTVRGNLEYGFKRLKPAERQVAFDAAVEMLGLREFLVRRPAELSGGERQRAAIARSLLTSPRLLLMDEPLTALDAESKAGIIPYLERLHDELKIPVIYVSHAFDEVARLADHLVLMERGRVTAAGPLIELTSRLDSPLARSADVESVIEARVAEQDDEFHLTHLDFAGGRLTIARTNHPIGHPVRVRVPARDVSLTLERQSGTSILNIFSATVVGASDDHPGQTTVRLDLGGGVAILSRITRKSAVGLEIVPGKKVFAQVKSVSVLGPEGRRTPHLKSTPAMRPPRTE